MDRKEWVNASICIFVMEHAERGDFAPEIKIEFFILYESQ